MITFSGLQEKVSPMNPKEFIKLFSVLDNQIIGKYVSIRKLKDLIAKSLYKYDIIEVDAISSNNVDVGTLNVNAGYVHDNDPDYVVIDLNVVYNPKDKKIELNKYSWEYTKRLFADALVHEFIHNAQYIARGGKDQHNNIKLKHAKSKDIKNLKYHGNEDELNAFAVNAASELLYFYKTKAKVLKALKNFTTITIKQSPVFDTYNSLFKKNSKVMKKFIKLVTYHINKQT